MRPLEAGLGPGLFGCRLVPGSVLSACLHELSSPASACRLLPPSFRRGRAGRHGLQGRGRRDRHHRVPGGRERLLCAWTHGAACRCNRHAAAPPLLLPLAHSPSPPAQPAACSSAASRQPTCLPPFPPVPPPQMDIKVEGITLPIMAEALSAAAAGRAHILKEMARCAPPPRGALSPYAPRILQVRYVPSPASLRCLSVCAAVCARAMLRGAAAAAAAAAAAPRLLCLARSLDRPPPPPRLYRANPAPRRSRCRLRRWAWPLVLEVGPSSSSRRPRAWRCR